MSSISPYTRRNLELRAAEYYAGVCKSQREWCSIMDLEPQLTEFDHRIQAGDYDGACLVLEPIDYEYLFKWGYYDRVINLRRCLVFGIKDTSLKISNFGRLGNACMAVDYVNDALDFYRKAIVLAREFGDRWSESAWLSRLGNLYLALGQPEIAKKLHNKALTIDSATGERVGIGWHLGNLAHVYFALGQDQHASDLYERSLGIARERDDSWMIGSQLRYLARVSLRCDKLLEAEQYYENALRITRNSQHNWGIRSSLLGLSRVKLAQGDLVAAKSLCFEALNEDQGSGVYEVLLVMGLIELHMDLNIARNAFHESSSRALETLNRADNLYGVRYTLAASSIGEVICDVRWVEKEHQAELLAPVLKEYHRALRVFSASGVIRDALRDLELIRAAGIEGLEPVFALLEATLDAEDARADYRKDNFAPDLMY